MTIRDTGYCPSRWEFDEQVTAVFDDMLKRSIPGYDTMRELVYRLACLFRVPGTDIVDLGCSRGEALAPLVADNGQYYHFVGVDVSEPMLEAARERFAKIPEDTVEILNLDLRTSYPDVMASVTLCVLTLMFIPMEHRLALLGRIFEHTRPGGALILVDKVMGRTDPGHRAMVNEYHSFKVRQGYSQEDVDRKALALEGQLVPVTDQWNESLLAMAGFRTVQPFWRQWNFAGWLALRLGE